MRRACVLLLAGLFSVVILGGDAYAASGLQVKCDREGAAIYLNGKTHGKCPRNIVVQPGTYKVVIREDLSDGSYYYYETQVNLADNQIEKVEAKVKRMYPEEYYREKAKSGGSVGGYREYLSKYPKGRHSEEMRRALNEIEDFSYLQAKNSRSEEACSAYLTKFPDGRYAAELKGLCKEYVRLDTVLIKGGCFKMGDPFGDGNKDEKPVHEICVSDFHMGTYEVTVGQFRKFVSDTGYRTEAESGGGCFKRAGSKWEKDRGATWRRPGFPQDDRHPVVCVSWNDAVAFADWVKGKTGKGYRLPTEAEWEYAARSGGKAEKYAGFSEESEIYRYGNFCDRSCAIEWKTADQDDGWKFTAPVGSYKANGLGIHDMTGNVWEWVRDWYGEDYYGVSPGNDPTGPASGERKVFRDGSWGDGQWGLRAAVRGKGGPSFRNRSGGFRLALPVR